VSEGDWCRVGQVERPSHPRLVVPLCCHSIKSRMNLDVAFRMDAAWLGKDFHCKRDMIWWGKSICLLRPTTANHTLFRVGLRATLSLHVSSRWEQYEYSTPVLQEAPGSATRQGSRAGTIT
jgi:hypothetical protein